jgi:hypothetical protein
MPTDIPELGNEIPDVDNLCKHNLSDACKSRQLKITSFPPSSLLPLSNSRAMTLADFFLLDFNPVKFALASTHSIS